MNLPKNHYPRIVLREALSKYIQKKLIIDPLTTNPEEGEHLIEKYSHKAIKDLISREYHKNNQK